MQPDYMHTKQCLAHRMITVIQELANDPQESDFYFRIDMQNNIALTLADSEGKCICND